MFPACRQAGGMVAVSVAEKFRKVILLKIGTYHTDPAGVISGMISDLGFLRYHVEFEPAAVGGGYYALGTENCSEVVVHAEQLEYILDLSTAEFSYRFDAPAVEYLVSMVVTVMVVTAAAVVVMIVVVMLVMIVVIVTATTVVVMIVVMMLVVVMLMVVMVMAAAAVFIVIVVMMFVVVMLMFMIVMVVTAAAGIIMVMVMVFVMLMVVFMHR